MSVLSEKDIIKELGKGIVILPFEGKEQNLRGSCIRLTASKYAYSFIPGADRDAKCLANNFQDSNKQQYIQISKGETAIVWTNEFIFLNNYLCGSIHSKVKLASKGVGHIGTRVNPNWGGILAIALHNLSKVVMNRNGNPIDWEEC